jgi:hypothetical protein
MELVSTREQCDEVTAYTGALREKDEYRGVDYLEQEQTWSFAVVLLVQATQR